MYKRLLVFYALIVVSILGLTIFVENYPLSNFDLNVTAEIQEHRALDFTPLMNFISLFGNPGVALLLILIASLMFALGDRRRAAWCTFAVIPPDLCNILIKMLVHRPRPPLEDIKGSLHYPESAFPSGHVVHYVVFFGFLLAVMLTDKSISIFWRLLVGSISTFLILTVSVSRIYLGAHWATDVIGGYLFGFAYLGIILIFYLRAPDFKTSSPPLPHS